jgi:hypothetical protein
LQEDCNTPIRVSNQALWSAAGNFQTVHGRAGFGSQLGAAIPLIR